MKGKRLVDVLDDKGVNPKHREFWDRVFGKLKKLGTAIEMHFGDRMNIDHPEYRWVNDRIEYYEAEERLLTKEEMQTANDMWNRYKNN
tara:strand:+ start:247 stop:510 length:264 start_codon:yes stop_codon:yes gene_type:complete